MKTKLIGLAILLVVIIGAVLYVVLSDEKEMTEINGFVGGEKIGMLEDEEIQEILRDDYGLVIDYAKAGSIDMISSDSTGKDFLFPSNQTALELYIQQNGTPRKSEIILNTPIVLYTRSAVAEALLQKGIASKTDGVYYVDGGLLMNLPVTTLRPLCRTVVAINVSTLPSQAIDMSFVDIALRSYNLMFQANSILQKEQCDLLIEPQGLDVYGNNDLDKAEEIFEVFGRKFLTPRGRFSLAGCIRRGHSRRGKPLRIVYLLENYPPAARFGAAFRKTVRGAKDS